MSRNNSTRPKKGKKQNKRQKNVLPIRLVAVIVALNHVEVL